MPTPPREPGRKGRPRHARLELLVRTPSGDWRRRPVSSLEEARLALIASGTPGAILAAAGAMDDDLLARLGAPSSLVVTASADTALAKANRPREAAVASRRRVRRTGASGPRLDAPLLDPGLPGWLLDTPLLAIGLSPGVRAALPGRATVGDLAGLTNADLVAGPVADFSGYRRLRKALAKALAEGPPGAPGPARPTAPATIRQAIEEAQDAPGQLDMAILRLRLVGREGRPVPARVVAAELGLSAAGVNYIERRALGALAAHTGLLAAVDAGLAALAAATPVPLPALLRQPWAEGLAPGAVALIASRRAGLRVERRRGGDLVVATGHGRA